SGVRVLLSPREVWASPPPTPPALLILIDPSSPGPFWPNINLVVQDLGKLTTEEFVTLTRLQLKALGDNAVAERDEPMGPAGHLFEFLAHAGPVPTRCLQHVFFHLRRAYILTAVAASQQFEAYRERFESSFRSVALKI